MKKIILVLGVILVCFLSGCSGKKATVPTEITFIHGWGATEEDHKAMRQIYMDFEKENPDIKINMLSMPTNKEMINFVEDMLSVGTVPDIIFTAGEGENSIYRFMLENDMLVDLAPYMEKDFEFETSISPITKVTWKQQDHLYTASDVLIVSGGYWYNKDLLELIGIEKIPTTWDCFFKMLETINRWSQARFSTVEAIRPSTNTYLYIADNILNDSGEMLTKGKIKMSEESFAKVCDTWKRLDDNIHMQSRNISYRDETDLFNNGKLAIYPNGVWAASMIKPDINAGYALFPSAYGQTMSCQSAALGYLVGNTGDEKKIQASIRFLTYMLSLPVQKRILLETQQMPQNPEIEIADYEKDLERFSMAVKEIQSAKIRLDIPQNLWSESQRETIELYLSSYLNGGLEENSFYQMCVE